MEQYASIQPIPSQFNMTNPVSTSGELKKDSSCQPSFTYFEKGNQTNPLWGSEKPIKETCTSDFKPHSGTPTHAIWNNSTKRKTIISRN